MNGKTIYFDYFVTCRQAVVTSGVDDTLFQKSFVNLSNSRPLLTSSLFRKSLAISTESILSGNEKG